MVYLSNHAQDNWRDRTPETTSKTIQWGWDHGSPVDHVTSFFENEEGEIADEVRLLHAVTPVGDEYAMILIRQDDTLVTTYDYSGVSDNRVEAYLDEISYRSLVYE